MKFGIAGSGNVATHLSKALVDGGAECLVVYSRTADHARSLADQIGADYTSDLWGFFSRSQVADVVLLSVSDNAIPGVASACPEGYGPVVLHTSGSTPIEVLAGVPDYGVLYPMQTFSKERAVSLSEVPFFVEYSSHRAEEVIHSLVRSLGSSQVQQLSSEDRMRVHMAAVFGCNFVNHLYAMAAECLEGTGVPFHALEPLLRETLRKALSNSPFEVQTGPAVRNDTLTMDKHLRLLESHPHLSEVYRTLSASIHECNS